MPEMFILCAWRTGTHQVPLAPVFVIRMRAVEVEKVNAGWEPEACNHVVLASNSMLNQCSDGSLRPLGHRRPSADDRRQNRVDEGAPHIELIGNLISARSLLAALSEKRAITRMH